MGFGWGFSSPFLDIAGEKIYIFNFPSDRGFKKWECFEQVEEVEPRKKPVSTGQKWPDYFTEQLRGCISYQRYAGNFISVTSDWYLTNPGLKTKAKFFIWACIRTTEVICGGKYCSWNHYHSKMFSLGSVCLVKLRSLTKPSGASKCWMAIF